MSDNTTQPVIQTHGLSKHYKGVNALKQLDLHLNSGETLGLFGHNGAGKTTLIKLILGVLSPSRGEIKVFGQAPDSPEARSHKVRIGFLPENVSFYEQLTGMEVLTYFSRLKGHGRQTAQALIDQVGLTGAAARKVKTYSKGMKQRLGLAQAFIGQPDLLLLDEPTVGLDPVATAEFYHTIEQLKQGGTSIVLCSHVLPGVEPHINRALILSAGTALATGTLTELRQQAGLPVAIRATGLNGALRELDSLKPYVKGADALMVPPAEKLAVLRTLLQQQQITDVSIHQPSLADLYQHYQQQEQSHG